MNKVILFLFFFTKAWCVQESDNPIQPFTSEEKNTEYTNNHKWTDLSNEHEIIKFIDSLSIDSFLTDYPDFKYLKKDLLDFYAQRNFSYAWIQEDQIAEPTYAIYTKVLESIDHGIKYDAPYLNLFKSLMENQYLAELKNSTQIELMISCQYIFYTKSINPQLNEKEIESLAWFIKKNKVDPLALFNSLLNDSANKNTALYPQYYDLLDGLKIYINAEKSGKWSTIKLYNNGFNLGDKNIEIAKIRRNLFLLEDIKYDSGEDIFDSSLEIGIYSFQERHGLKKQPLVDVNLIRVMNVSLQERIKKILINMERCKWLPNETNGDYIIVNIPQYNLEAHTADSIAFSCKVVVGKETNRTMIFKGDMKYIVFNPYWNVPESILKNEIIPAIRRNANYLNENNMEWYDGRLRQRPGDDNALGRVKFMFPNIFNIYLHDTPSKQLFEMEKRTFSHGCIRIAEPIKMVKFLLRDDASWNEQKIIDEMFSDKERVIKLKKGIPVYVIYLTSFIDEKGKLNFRDDVYGRDMPLNELLFGKKTVVLD